MVEHGGAKFGPEGGESGLCDLLREEGARAFLESEAYEAAEAAYESAIDVNAFCDSPEFMEGFRGFSRLDVECA